MELEEGPASGSHTVPPEQPERRHRCSGGSAWWWGLGKVLFRLPPFCFQGEGGGGGSVRGLRREDVNYNQLGEGESQWTREMW